VTGVTGGSKLFAVLTDPNNTDTVWKWVALGVVPLLLLVQAPMMAKGIKAKEIPRLRELGKESCFLNFYDPIKLVVLVTLIVSMSFVEKYLSIYYAATLVFPAITFTVSFALLYCAIHIFIEWRRWDESAPLMKDFANLEDHPEDGNAVGNLSSK
jgi:hypothetical protein